MAISFNFMNRIIEEKMAKDEEYRRIIEQNGKALLSEGRSLSDHQLLEKLRDLGLPLDRAEFEQCAERFYSVQHMTEALIKERQLAFREARFEDWVWIACTCLWERWLPDRPSFEMIDERMQEGYDVLEGRDGSVLACRIWWGVWTAIERIIVELRLPTLEKLDDLLGGTQFVFNWIQDLERELLNAGRQEVDFLRKRVTLCDTVLQLSPGQSALFTENFRRALAESHAFLGDIARAESLFDGWLEADPRWGWGWIGWSDLFNVFDPAELNPEKAERILRRGLQVPDVRDRADILDRLHSQYEDTGRSAEASDVAQQLREARAQEKAALPGSPSSQSSSAEPKSPPAHPVAARVHGMATRTLPGSEPLSSSVAQAKPKQQVGRNDLCPCGSGKKFKRCCLRKG